LALLPSFERERKSAHLFIFPRGSRTDSQGITETDGRIARLPTDAASPEPELCHSYSRRLDYYHHYLRYRHVHSYSYPPATRSCRVVHQSPRVLQEKAHLQCILPKSHRPFYNVFHHRSRSHVFSVFLRIHHRFY